MTERFEIFPQNVAKDGTLIIIQKGLKLKGFKLYNINDVVELLNTLHEENEQLRKEKIDVEVRLYSANEKILMQMDYDEIIKQNTESEMEIINLKKENEQLEKENKELRSDRKYWKTLAQSLAKNNGNVKLKDEHIGWKRVDVE